MRALCKWLICGLLLVAHPGIAWSAGHPTLLPITGGLIAALPDSIRLKMLALLAEGDIAGAIALWQVHSGRTDIPKVLEDLQVAFQVTSRALNSCTHVARTIHAGFRHFGGTPEYVDAFTGSGGMLEKNYLQNIVMAGEPIIKTVVSP